MYWYKKVVLENYANFNGRARRSEYWYFTLFNIIFSSILKIIDNLLFDDLEILGSVYGLAVFIPGLAVSVRRFHDIGKSGWQLLIAYLLLIALFVVIIVSSLVNINDGMSGWMIIPFGLMLVIAIWLLVLFCTEGDSFTNKYGPDPKADDEEINQIGISD